MRMHIRPQTPLAFLVLLILFASTSMARPQAAPAGGIIAGHVVFADTDRPARFATVYLKPVAPPNPGDDFFTVLMDSAIVNMQTKQGPSTDDSGRELSAAKSAANGFLAGVSDAMLSATVAANGDYAFTGVPPGQYYVHAKAPGYIDPLAAFSGDELASRDPDLRKKIAAAVDIVSIGGREQVRENLRLDRGAVLCGRVLYDDGSPATGWTVRAVRKQLAGAEPPTSVLGIDLTQLPTGQQPDRAVTDDTGHFRIAGLPSGAFILQANLTTAALDRQPFSGVSSTAGSFLSILGGLSDLSGLRVTVYSGSAMRLHDASVLKLRAGEESMGNDMVVPLGTAHTITGSVLARADGHAINSGTVELIVHDKQGQDDPSLRLTATIQPNGTFRFDYVPAPATYTMRSVHVSDTSVSSVMKLLGSMIAEHKTNRTYAPSSTVVELEDADVSGIKLTVDDSQTQTSKIEQPAH